MGRDLGVVRLNMKNMVGYSRKEFAEYKRSGDVVLLQQAGEKLFSAVENYISLKFDVAIISFYDAKSLVNKDKKWRDLLYDARDLHKFFYNGEGEMSLERAEKLYNSVLGRLLRVM